MKKKIILIINFFLLINLVSSHKNIFLCKYIYKILELNKNFTSCLELMNLNEKKNKLNKLEKISIEYIYDRIELDKNFLAKLILKKFNVKKKFIRKYKYNISSINKIFTNNIIQDEEVSYRLYECPMPITVNEELLLKYITKRREIDLNFFNYFTEKL